MMLEEGNGDNADRCRFARADTHARQIARLVKRTELPLDGFYNASSFLGVAVSYQPARAFGYPEPHQKNNASKRGANEECKPPAEIRIK